jgi:hypothetical protein
MAPVTVWYTLMSRPTEAAKMPPPLEYRSWRGERQQTKQAAILTAARTLHATRGPTLHGPHHHSALRVENINSRTARICLTPKDRCSLKD